MSEPSTVSFQKARYDIAPNVVEQPLYVGWHDNGEDGCRMPAWVANSETGLADANISGYRPVDFKDVEQLEPGSTKPHSKDFGVQFEPTKRSDGRVIGPGNVVLVWIHAGRYRARRAAEAARGARQTVKPNIANIPRQAYITGEESSAIEEFS